LNVVFCVYRQWSLEILKGLLKAQDKKKWKISLVIVVEGETLDFSGMDELLKDVKIISINPKKIEDYVKEINVFKPQAIFFYSWSWIIPEAIRNIAPCLLLHPSHLPKYRGGSPIQNQILAGVKESSVTILYAIDKLDAGNILAQESISFEGYLDEILKRIEVTGIKLTIIILDKMLHGKIIGEVQDESKATISKRRTPAMSEITLDEIKTKSAEYLYDKIRCLQKPYPESYIICGDGKKLFLERAHLEENKKEGDKDI
jgi:methionyl-tRNA formyltransferase